MLEERRLAVLRAIVEDYVSPRSRSGPSRSPIATSSAWPATVRNDMAALEDEGYITQPHTSAGRVPTDKGYRLFVDRLSTVKPLSRRRTKAIQSFLDGAVDLDDVVRRSVRLLAQLTRQVAVVQYPTLSRSAVRHIEVVTSRRAGCCWCSSPTPAGSSSASSSWPARSTMKAWRACVTPSTPRCRSGGSPRRSRLGRCPTRCRPPPVVRNCCCLGRARGVGRAP